ARLRTVIEAYYFNQRPMAELAAELGVTESRISQLRAEATVLLRDALNTVHTTNPTPAPATATAQAEGCAARRRTAYYAAVAAHGTLRTRLAHTTTTGLPLGIA
ncbi:sigma factor-like helix-turn-helix DNA-binding protein, partial [Actinophytocola xanthii]